MLGYLDKIDTPKAEKIEPGVKNNSTVLDIIMDYMFYFPVEMVLEGGRN